MAKFKVGQVVYIEDGFDGFIKSEITAVVKKDKVVWYNVKGAIRLYPESMLYENNSNEKH